MEKEKVIIEEIEDEKVALYHFDEEYDKVVGLLPFEVCSKIIATEQYDIVGEMINGETELYEMSMQEEDFSEFSQIDEEDDSA